MGHMAHTVKHDGIHHMVSLTCDDPLLCNVFFKSFAEVDLAAIFSHGAVVNQQEVRVVTVQHHVGTFRCRDCMIRCHNLKYTWHSHVSGRSTFSRSL